MVEKVKAIWMNGKLVDWDDAKVHVLSHSLHYGLGFFEGIRSYKTESDRSAIFGLEDHMQRLINSAKIANIEIPYGLDELCQAALDTIIHNGLEEGYIRPLVFLGAGAMGIYPANNPVQVIIATWKWGKYLGADALTKGIRAKISTYNRYHPNSMMTQSKTSGNYTLSILAKMEAVQQGYDEAILLDVDGYVAEGSGENIFVIHEGKIKTTPLTCVLPGLTRQLIMIIAREMGYEVQEQRFTRDRLYIADEAFFTGTAAEVTPIREVDGRQIGNGAPGPHTQKLQQAYFDIVRGKDSTYAKALTYYDCKQNQPEKIVLKEAI